MVAAIFRCIACCSGAEIEFGKICVPKKPSRGTYFTQFPDNYELKRTNNVHTTCMYSEIGLRFSDDSEIGFEFGETCLNPFSLAM